MDIMYVNYNQCVEISFNALIVAAWNKGNFQKVFLNNKEFFENSFNNSFDAAHAASLSGKWSWKDDFVCFDKQGYLTSFSRWDDENSPIEMDKLDLSQLIEGLEKWQKKSPQGDISIAIRDALK